MVNTFAIATKISYLKSAAFFTVSQPLLILTIEKHISEVLRKAFGLLVLLGFDITAFTPVAYQGRSLQPPYNEVSS